MMSGIKMFSELYEPPCDKTNKMTVHSAKTQISLGIRPVWSESSLSAWRKLGSLATHWAHSKDSDQTGQMPRLIWVFAGRTVTLGVLSWGGSYGILHHWSTRLIQNNRVSTKLDWHTRCMCGTIKSLRQRELDKVESHPYKTMYLFIGYSINYLQLSRSMTKPTHDLCTQWKLSSVWASAQSDQSLCFVL